MLSLEAEAAEGVLRLIAVSSKTLPHLGEAANALELLLRVARMQHGVRDCHSHLTLSLKSRLRSVILSPSTSPHPHQVRTHYSPQPSSPVAVRQSTSPSGYSTAANSAGGHSTAGTVAFAVYSASAHTSAPHASQLIAHLDVGASQRARFQHAQASLHSAVSVMEGCLSDIDPSLLEPLAPPIAAPTTIAVPSASASPSATAAPVAIAAPSAASVSFRASPPSSAGVSNAPAPATSTELGSASLTEPALETAGSVAPAPAKLAGGSGNMYEPSGAETLPVSASEARPTSQLTIRSSSALSVSSALANPKMGPAAESHSQLGPSQMSYSQMSRSGSTLSKASGLSSRAVGTAYEKPPTTLPPNACLLPSRPASTAHRMPRMHTGMGSVPNHGDGLPRRPNTAPQPLRPSASAPTLAPPTHAAATAASSAAPGLGAAASPAWGTSGGGAAAGGGTETACGTAAEFFRRRDARRRKHELRRQGESHVHHGGGGEGDNRFESSSGARPATAAPVHDLYGAHMATLEVDPSSSASLGRAAVMRSAQDEYYSILADTAIAVDIAMGRPGPTALIQRARQARAEDEKQRRLLLSEKAAQRAAERAAAQAHAAQRREHRLSLTLSPSRRASMSVVQPEYAVGSSPLAIHAPPAAADGEAVLMQPVGIGVSTGAGANSGRSRRPSTESGVQQPPAVPRAEVLLSLPVKPRPRTPSQPTHIVYQRVQLRTSAFAQMRRTTGQTLREGLDRAADERLERYKYKVRSRSPARPARNLTCSSSI